MGHREGKSADLSNPLKIMASIGRFRRIAKRCFEIREWIKNNYLFLIYLWLEESPFRLKEKKLKDHRTYRYFKLYRQSLFPFLSSPLTLRVLIRSVDPTSPYKWEWFHSDIIRNKTILIDSPDNVLIKEKGDVLFLTKVEYKPPKDKQSKEKLQAIDNEYQKLLDSAIQKYYAIKETETWTRAVRLFFHLTWREFVILIAIVAVSPLLPSENLSMVMDLVGAILLFKLFFTVLHLPHKVTSVSIQFVENRIRYVFDMPTEFINAIIATQESRDTKVQRIADCRDNIYKASALYSTFIIILLGLLKL